MKVHLLHLLFNLLFDFLCKDFLTRNICTYLPTFYFLLFIIEYSHFFQRLHNYAPNFFYGLTANDLFLCDYIIEVRDSYAIMTKISTFFYLPFSMTEFLLLCLIQIRNEPIKYIRTRYIFLYNVENLEFYPFF